MSKSPFLLASIVVTVAASPAAMAADAAGRAVVFNRDIKPILAEACLNCHGADPGTRKAGLRLDTEDGLFQPGKDREAVVVKGQPARSPLWQRLTATDPDDVMPPPDAPKQLSPEDKEMLRRWIEEGATWQPHWAFIKPDRPPVPDIANPPVPVRNPIDAFWLDRLKGAGLTPNPEADRRALARRLSLDLVGLVPEPAEVEAFVADASPDYYEKYVQKLLVSPRYGEHRGRAWLDAARYADTHGLHFDNYREMWPYRDWVIDAYNRNMPFDQFIVDQLAGDLLPNPTMEQLIATGFQRCNITTNEGGTIEAENLANYARDRVETTSWVFLGLTANCAVCHDHKFDPVTTRDFYSMAAFFRNTTQSGFDGNNRQGANAHIVVPQTPDERARWAALPGEIASQEARLAERRNAAGPDFEKWLADAKSDAVGEDVDPKALVAHAPLTEGVGDEIGAVCGEPVKFKATGQVVWKPDGRIGPAPVLTAAANFDFGNQGDFEKDQPFSYGAWVRPAGNGAFGGIIARMDEDAAYRGWDLFQHGGEYAVHIASAWEGDALKVTTKGNRLKPSEWQHVFVTYDGSGKAGGVRIYIDGKPADVRQDKDALKGSIRTTVSLRIGQRSKGQAFEGGSVQDVRVYGRRLNGEEVAALHTHGPLRALLASDPAKRTPEQRQALFEHYLTTRDQAFQDHQKTIASLQGEREAIKARSPITHVQAEKKDSAPMAHILMRGNYDQLGEKVEANVFHALHPMPEGAPKNRLGLAQWLVSPENPLTARVTVNRLWQEIFGTGLVKTSDDFGAMGEAPVNQPLLDWLAEEFRASGWNVKHMVTLMVTSSAYRQSPVLTPEQLEKDRDNRLLSRGPRFRMDAEMIRDSALAASGLLSPRMGGPGTKPYQPDGVWDKVGMVEGDTRIYKQDTGENLYRRSVYNFWKRMAAPASLEIFNAPAREAACLRRERTNTPLQALVTLNDTQFIEAARTLAQKALLTAGPANTDAVIGFIAERLLSRPLRPEERGIVKGTLDDVLSYYRSDPTAAAALIAVGESKADPAVDPPTLAAWTMIANQLMNLDEVLNK
ncbi:MAG: DUF1553 domain-containing protein [Verrucomicrobiales bacterium]